MIWEKVMKLYKVFFDYDKNEWNLLNQGFLSFPSGKKKEYERRNEFNNLFLQSLIIESMSPCVNTFDERKISNSLFFFLDLVDAIEYTKYPNSKFGSFTQPTFYKILELDFPDELVLKYLGVGNYELERECTYHLSLEAAIPFDELEKLEQCSLIDSTLIQLNHVQIYDERSQNVIEILNYLNFNPTLS